MLNHVSNNNSCSWLLFVARHYSRIQPPRPVSVEPVISVSNNIARLDAPKEGPKPRQLLSLPPFPGHPLPDKSSISGSRQRDYVTAVNWIKYYFKGTWGSVIESHFREGLVSIYYFIVLTDALFFPLLPNLLSTCWHCLKLVIQFLSGLFLS